MGKRKLLKFFYLSLIAMQIVTLGQPHKALSIETNKDYIWKINSFEDSEDLKSKIIQDPDFIKKWAFMYHMLGFSWYGGTGSSRIGEDFIFERGFEKDNSGTTQEVYYLKGNYNSSDELSQKYGIDERLQMKISNVRLIIDPNTLFFGMPRIINTKYVTIASTVLENTSDNDNSISVSFTYIANNNWSKIDNFKLNEEIGVKTKFLASIPFSISEETKLNVEFSEEQGWKQSEGTTIYGTSILQYNSILPGKGKKQVELIGTEEELQVPYYARIYIDYDITLTGFLKESKNSHIDHPSHRLTKSITFGGDNGLNAAEDLFDKYSHRDIKEYSEWDWQRIIADFGKENMDYYIKEICKVKHGIKITGVFNTFGGTKIKLKTFDLEPIKTMSRYNSFSKDDKVEVKDFKSFETPGFNVKDMKINR